MSTSVGVDPNGDRFLTDLTRLQDRMAQLQRQLSSNRRVERPSDAPDDLSAILRAARGFDVASGSRDNLERVQGEVDAAEQAVANAVKLMDRAQTITALGVTVTTTPEVRLNLSKDVETVMNQLVSLANTAYGGRYLFAGDTDQVSPYTIDFTQLNGVSAYLGAPTTRQALDANGQAFSIAMTSQDLFDSGTGSNVFLALNNLRLALAQNNEAAFAQVSADIRTAADFLNNQQTFYGHTQKRISDSLDIANKKVLDQQIELNSLTSTDYAATSVELTQSQTALNASLQARSLVRRSSLFDYLR